MLFESGFLAAILPWPYKEQEMLEQVQGHQPENDTQSKQGSIEHSEYKKIILKLKRNSLNWKGVQAF